MKRVEYSWKSNVPEIPKEKLILEIKQSLIYKAIKETNADNFYAEFEEKKFTNDEIAQEIYRWSGENGVYFYCGVQVEYEELIKKIEDYCFEIRLKFIYDEVNKNETK